MTRSIVPERAFSDTLQEEVQLARLPSGLRVMFCPKPGFKKKYACYSTFYGSVDNRFVTPDGVATSVPDGIAHFLEHTLFEMEEGNVSDLFARNGAYNNAGTSFTTTTYLFASTDRFYDNLELLIRFVENPVFDPDKVEKEKGIIEQEIRGYEDNPQWVNYMGLLENLFVEHPLRIDIAGTAESIREIDADLLHRCYDTFYHPANMIIFFVGDLDPDELFGFVLAHSRSRGAGRGDSAYEIQRSYPREPARVHRTETRQRMPVALPKLLLGFKELDVPTSGREYVRRELVSSLALEILFGRSGDLYRDLYEQQLITDDFGASYNLGAGVGYGVVGGETPDPGRLRDALLHRAAALRTDGIRRDDFEREKRRFLGTFISTFNSLEFIANNYTHYRFYDFDLFEAVDLIAGVDQAAVEERLNECLHPERHAAHIIEPGESQ